MDSSRTALVIDDDDDVRGLITTVLSTAGYRWDAVAGGVPALDAAASRRPSVYVLDVRMPDMNGHEVCRQLKSDHRTSAPVLMVSAEASDADVAAGYQAGCDDFLAKPFSPRELLRRLDQLVGNAVA
jgi:DNA-binding response OmpR family regulator